MGWIDAPEIHIPAMPGSSSRWQSATIQTITSAAGAGNRKSSQMGRVNWPDGLPHAARYISYLTGAVTADAAAKLRTSIQGKTSGAFSPDGTILSAGAGANNAFSDDDIPAASTWTTVDLTALNAPTLAHLQMVSIVHEIDPDNVGTTASVVVVGSSQGGMQGEAGCAAWAPSAWTAAPTVLPNAMVTATDGTIGWIGPLAPGELYTTTAYNSGSTTNRFAAVFTAKKDMLIKGCRMGFTSLHASAQYNAVLRDSAGAQIGTNTQLFKAAEMSTVTQPWPRFMFPDGNYLFRRGATIMVSADPTTVNDLTIGTIKYPNTTIRDAVGSDGIRTYTSGAWDAVDPLSRLVWSLIEAEEFIPGLDTIGGGGSFDSDIAVLRG